jgi:hypothetical protein
MTRLADTGELTMSRRLRPFAEAKSCGDGECTFCPCGATRFQLHTPAIHTPAMPEGAAAGHAQNRIPAMGGHLGRARLPTEVDRLDGYVVAAPGLGPRSRSGPRLLVNGLEVMVLHLSESKPSWRGHVASAPLPTWTEEDRQGGRCVSVVGMGVWTPDPVLVFAAGAANEASRLRRHRSSNEKAALQILYGGAAVQAALQQNSGTGQEGGGGAQPLVVGPCDQATAARYPLREAEEAFFSGAPDLLSPHQARRKPQIELARTRIQGATCGGQPEGRVHRVDRATLPRELPFF